MKWFEVVEDLGDGSSTTRRFRTYAEAEKYEAANLDYCYSGINAVDTDSPSFFYSIEE